MADIHSSDKREQGLIKHVLRFNYQLLDVISGKKKITFVLLSVFRYINREE